MLKAIYSLIATAIVTGWSYFGQPHPPLNRSPSSEERHQAIHRSTWVCQDCHKISGIDKIRCPDCGTKQGQCTLAYP